MLEKPAKNISLRDLNDLVGNVRESKTLEYKREMRAGIDKEKIKFLATVSAFANTAGGDLLIGVEAIDGIATAIPGIEDLNVDGEVLRLSNLLSTSIEPRLPSVEIHPIDCDGGHHVLLIRVRRSWIAPHRVTLDNKFYGRNSGGKYPLDVSELRTAFTLSDTITDRMERFRVDRLIKVAAGETPLPLSSRPAMMIHVMPFSAFADRQNIDVVSLTKNGYVMPLPPGRQNHGNNSMVNLAGLVTFTNQPKQPAHAYAQAFRNGAVEGVEVLSLDEASEPYIASGVFESNIVATVQNYLHFLASIEFPPPAFVFLSFGGIRGCHLRHKGDGIGPYYSAGPLSEDTILLPAVMVGSEGTDIAGALHPIFNIIWNAFGLMR